MKVDGGRISGARFWVLALFRVQGFVLGLRVLALAVSTPTSSSPAMFAFSDICPRMGVTDQATVNLSFDPPDYTAISARSCVTTTLH